MLAAVVITMKANKTLYITVTMKMTGIISVPLTGTMMTITLMILMMGRTCGCA
jgi:hypothetical protein